MLTRNELLGVMPGAAGMADRLIPALDAAMQRFDIVSPARRAAFLAQLAHESGELRRWTEDLTYRWQRLRQVFPKYFRTDAEAQPFDRQPERIANRVYGGRLGNGNEASGEGWRYRGRGPIQLTGKDNYRSCGQGIGVDLVNEPERLESPDVGCLAAAWFWASRGLNALADAGDFVTITKRINGGTIGLEERITFWKRAKAVFAVAAPVVAAAPRARRGMAGAATLEHAAKPAAAARKKPAKPRRMATAKAGVKAGKARVASAKKAATKAATPRAATARKTGTKVAKPRTATTKKAGTKAATTRVAAATKAATKTAKPRVSAAKKAATKPAQPRAAAARKTGTKKAAKLRASAARTAEAKAARPRTAPARKAGTTAAKPRAAAAKRQGAGSTGTARGKASKKAPRKASKPRASAVGRTSY